jgi:hypothetical protein
MVGTPNFQKLEDACHDVVPPEEEFLKPFFEQHGTLDATIAACAQLKADFEKHVKEADAENAGTKASSAQAAFPSADSAEYKELHHACSGLTPDEDALTSMFEEFQTVEATVAACGMMKASAVAAKVEAQKSLPPSATTFPMVGTPNFQKLEDACHDVVPPEEEFLKPFFEQHGTLDATIAACAQLKADFEKHVKDADAENAGSNSVQAAFPSADSAEYKELQHACSGLTPDEDALKSMFEEFQSVEATVAACGMMKASAAVASAAAAQKSLPPGSSAPVSKDKEGAKKGDKKGAKKDDKKAEKKR